MLHLIFLLFSSSLFAFDLLDFALVKDGVVTPPGDRVTLKVLLLPKETHLQYEIRLWKFLQGEDSLVRAKPNSKNIGPGGELFFSGIIKRDRPLESADDRVIVVGIPFEDIDLPNGRHEIYYEASLTPFEGEKRGETQIAATRLTAVTHGDGVREILTQAKVMTLAFVETKVETKGFYISPKGEVTTKTTEVIEKTVSAGAPEKITYNVNIPGQFKREEVSGKSTQPTVSAAKFIPQRLRTIRFATNRKPKDNQNWKKGFTAHKGELIYGTATVNIPITTHKVGQMKTKGWFGGNPKTDFLMELILPKDKDSFFRELNEDDKILYVHGYRTTFDDAIFTAAQYQHQIEFPGKMVIFSWPSNGTTTGYWDDEKKAEGSVDAMAEVIESLFRTAPEKELNILAHSMGNRVVLLALNKLYSENRIPSNAKIRKLVLAAPDVDINLFGAIMARLNKMIGRTTFYYSSKDLALWASSKDHPMNRAGSHPSFFDGMDTICVDDVNSKFTGFGHGYINTSDRLVLDMKLDIVRNLSVKRRHPPLTQEHELKNFPGFPHFGFLPAS